MCVVVRVDITGFWMRRFQPPGGIFENYAHQDLDAEFIAIAHDILKLIEHEAIFFRIVIYPRAVNTDGVELVFLCNRL